MLKPLKRNVTNFEITSNKLSLSVAYCGCGIVHRLKVLSYCVLWRSDSLLFGTGFFHSFAEADAESLVSHRVHNFYFFIIKQFSLCSTNC